jgi:hypothetical protein
MVLASFRERLDAGRGALGEPLSCTTSPQEIAWRVFTKGVDAAEARAQTRVEGDETIGLHILRMISIVA